MERIRGGMRAVRSRAARLLAAVVLGAVAPVARADGDPASDALLYQNLFVGWNAGVPFTAQQNLGNFVTSANRHGLRIRVAVIGAPGDLGSITALWGEPRAYAGFLGIELSLVYTQRLLIVMPGGFGLNWAGHATAAGYRALAGIRIPHGGPGLVSAAEAAVRALAANAGISLGGTVPAARVPAGAGQAGAAGTAARMPALLVAIVGCTALASSGAAIFGLLARRSRRRRA
jgi:hypothetical protein